MNQKCSESNELSKDEDSKLKKKEEKRKECRQQRYISLAIIAFCHMFYILML
jgi:hypothetical protein